jgi:WD40 repeat protein
MLGTRRNRQPAPTRYWAFISYSRQDDRWARWLQRRIEAFTIPRSVRPKIRKLGLRSIRLRPVFRDVDDLAASANLADALKTKLEASEVLIVLASPRSAHSSAVALEIDHFLSLGKTGRQLIAIIDGEPRVANSAMDSTAAFSPLVAKGPEPLWVDFRAESEPRKRALVRLIAGILEVGFDELWRKHRRLLRRRLVLRGIASVVVAAVVAAAFLAVDVLEFRARLLKKAEQAIRWQNVEDSFQKHLDIEARQSLLAAMAPPGSLVKSRAQEERASFLIEIAGLQARTLDAGSIVHDVRFSKDGRLVAAGDYAGRTHVWSVATGDLVSDIRIESCHDDDRTFGADCDITKVAFSPDGSTLAALSSDGHLAAWETRSWSLRFEGQVSQCPITGTATSKVHLPCPGKALFFPADNSIAVVTGDGWLQVFASNDGRRDKILRLHTTPVLGVAVSPRGQIMLSLAEEGEFVIWSTLSLTERHRARLRDHVDVRMLSAIALSDDGSTFLANFSTDYVSMISVIDGSEVKRILPIDAGEPTMSDNLVDDPATYQNAQAIAVCGDGLWQAFGYGGSNIEAWSVKNNDLPLLLVGHEAELQTLEFTEDCKILASGSTDGTVRLWYLQPDGPRVKYGRADLTGLAAQGQLTFSEEEWRSDWRLRMRHPDPAKWRGIMSAEFWKRCPYDLYSGLIGNYRQN